jgi:hypothetical protein
MKRRVTKVDILASILMVIYMVVAFLDTSSTPQSILAYVGLTIILPFSYMAVKEEILSVIESRKDTEGNE